MYPEHNIYFFTNADCLDILDGNPNVHKVLQFQQEIDDPFILEGRADHEGYFDIAYFPNTTTQKFVSYTHNCKDKIDFDLQCT